MPRMTNTRTHGYAMMLAGVTVTITAGLTELFGGDEMSSRSLHIHEETGANDVTDVASRVSIGTLRT
jgi:hypothetical protein